MINKLDNIQKNLMIKHMNNSDVLAYNKDFIATSIDTNFNILEAFKGSEKQYAKYELAIKNNDCIMGDNCDYEMDQILLLKEAPQKFIDFMVNVGGELMTTENKNFDPNNNADYTVANSVMTDKPGFSIDEGYNVSLDLLEDGTQQLVFNGPMFYETLVFNNSTVKAILENKTYLIAPTPDVPTEMNALLVEIGVFEPNMFDQESKKLIDSATISEEFVLKNVDGTPDYEIIDIGNGKGRNILRYDLDKIKRKSEPFIKAEVNGLLSSEQQAIAAWNVYLAQDSEDEEVIISQDIYAWEDSWSYETDLPLSEDKRFMFLDKYTKVFSKNYLMNYTINQLPYIEEDAGIFDLEEMKTMKAQKFIDDNNLN